MDNEFTDNKLYSDLKSTKQKVNMPGICIRPIMTYIGSALYNDNKYIDDILKAYVKDETNNVKISVFTLKMRR